jgi:hypothetical protein
MMAGNQGRKNGPAHTPEARWQPGWNEWRPECQCGWVGSYWTLQVSAQAEADKHADLVNALDDQRAAEGDGRG